MFSVVVFCLVQQRFNSWLSETPSTSVQGLFLAPNDGLGVGVFVEVIFELSPWEWIQLFNTGDGGWGDVVVGTVFVESGVDLTGAKDYAVDLLWRIDGFAMLGIFDNPLEAAVIGEFFNGWAGKWVAQKGLGKENDES